MRKERRITIRLATDLHEDLIRYAIRQGMTVSGAVRDLIEGEKFTKAARDWSSR